MGWIRDLLSLTEDSIENERTQQEERFPRHTYGPGYPIVVHRQELNDLFHLLEKESEVPDGWESTPFLSREDFEEVIEDVVGDLDGEIPSPEERRDELRKILELWEDQLNGPEDTVWTTIGTDHQFKYYITHCENRADSEYDEFEEPDELDTVRRIVDRIRTAQDTDAKLAVVDKRHLPLETPKESPSETI
ncbi:hypothetical protein [Halosimplex pelagicum]|uniref:Uncharacterized protein n=1 Tax=Halosimplex pelagicum TaxID=869886 RepID=A0A7D5T6H0_9EURY|nr:hypothetical protein [Halosimplex pelagicum]QLH83328.1 hypothetical protein HZS54_17550 [Halosimplex pelagicum]